MKVGFIGLGRMGLPMAKNLLAAGFSVTGCDLDPRRTELLEEAGGATAASPAKTAVDASIVFSMIMNDAILRDVASGVASAARPGAIYCDLSTVSPAASADARAMIEARGVSYLCGKVAGSVGLAESAGLSLFASGDEAAFERCVPAFKAMSARVRHVGAGEAAAHLKLVHSHIVGVYSAMIGEALAFGEKGGLSLETMLDVLEEGPLGSLQLTLKKPILTSRAFDAPPSDIDTAAKDVDIILETARRERTPTPLLSAARTMTIIAQAQGRGKRDIYAILETFEQLAGIES